MCGRYHLTEDPHAALATSGIVEATTGRPPFEPRYNIAPSEPPAAPGSTRRTPPRTTRVPIARASDARAVVEDALWPLVPLWANGEVTRYSTANARAETMREGRTYRHAWEHGQRCLVPATGFYEWQDAGERTKQPWSIEPLNEDLFTFGGLWETSRRADGTPVLSFTIVTVPANPLMREIHNAGKNRHRMPLIVDADAREAWLGGDGAGADALIAPYPADEMRARPVGRAVNNPGLDEARVLKTADGGASSSGADG